MYKNNQLNYERLEFIVEYCTKYLNISSHLMDSLMKNNNKELLTILFKKQYKFFDKKFILNLLIYYKNQNPLSHVDLYPIINNEKYKIPVNDPFLRFKHPSSLSWIIN